MRAMPGIGEENEPAWGASAEWMNEFRWLHEDVMTVQRGSLRMFFRYP